MNLNYKKKIKNKRRRKEESKENLKIKMIHSTLTISKFPIQNIYNFMPKKILNEKEKKQMKDNETNTDSCVNLENTKNKNLSVDKNIISLKNYVRPASSNIYLPHFYKNINMRDNLIRQNNKINNYYYNLTNKKQSQFKTIKKRLTKDNNFNIQKRVYSSYKRNDNYKNDDYFITPKHFEMKKNKSKIWKNYTNTNNSFESNTKKSSKKNINTFFNNKYLQENTDTFKIAKLLLNKNNLNIKFSTPKSENTYKIVDNNISLENTFKKQTLSNFNNKYNFKFRTTNLKEKEKIKELFHLLKKHKDSEKAKNSDFLSFHLYIQKKLKEKEIYKELFEEYLNPDANVREKIDELLLYNNNIIIYYMSFIHKGYLFVMIRAIKWNFSKAGNLIIFLHII